MRRRQGTLSGSPALVGAAAVMLSIFAVFISYHADSGLPLEPRYKVQVVLPDAEHFGKTGDVRLAGVLVGRVGDRRLEVRPDGTTRAVLELSLDKTIEPLPGDTTVRMRANSSLGGNYVELLPGRSTRPLHGAIDAEHAPPEISLSDSLEAYDARTRGALARWLSGAGDSVAGRGRDINALVRAAPSTLTHLEGAMAVLAASDTGLGRFIDGFTRLSEAIAPVADQQAGFFRGLDATLGAMASVRGDVADATSASPPLLEAGIAGLGAQRDLIDAGTDLFAVLRPGLHAVSGAAGDVRAAAVGSPAALRALEPLSPRLADSGRALTRLAAEPIVVPSLTTLTATFSALSPTLSDLRAAQAVCDYPGVALRNLQSVLSEGMSTGNFVNAGAVLVLPAPDGEAGPAAAPANNAGGDRPDNYLHSTLTPLTGAGSAPECESGNEKYNGGAQAIGHAPGRQPARTEATAPGRPR